MNQVMVKKQLNHGCGFYVSACSFLSSVRTFPKATFIVLDLYCTIVVCSLYCQLYHESVAVSCRPYVVVLYHFQVCVCLHLSEAICLFILSLTRFLLPRLLLFLNHTFWHPALQAKVAGHAVAPPSAMHGDNKSQASYFDCLPV